jgi:succinate dehydrogenase / fumarate reductase cytochrome b subunit
MAQPSNANNRPLSPHLQIWRWGPAMTVSILHRASGSGLAFIGLPLMLWWLAALVGGKESYDVLVQWVWSGTDREPLQAITNIIGRIVLVGLSWALFEHLLSGLRHFVLDIGAGYELKSNAAWSWIVMVGSVVLTIAFWAQLLLR